MNLNPINLGLKNLALIPGRVALSSTMIHHGMSKLKPDGVSQTARFFEQVGIKPGKPWGILTGLAEVFAGVSSLIGFGTRLGALGVIVTQVVAIDRVHKDKGFDIAKGGFEFNLALIGIALGLLVAGPGTISAHEGVEHALERRRRRLFARGPSKALKAVKWLK